MAWIRILSLIMVLGPSCAFILRHNDAGVRRIRRQVLTRRRDTDTDGGRVFPTGGNQINPIPGYQTTRTQRQNTAGYQQQATQAGPQGFVGQNTVQNQRQYQTNAAQYQGQMNPTTADQAGFHPGLQGGYKARFGQNTDGYQQTNAVGQGPYQTAGQNAVGQGQYQTPGQNAVGQGPYQTPGQNAVGQGPYQTPGQNAVGQGQYQTPGQNAVGQGQYQTPIQNAVGQGPYQTPRQNAVGQGPYQTPKQNAVGQGPYQTPRQNAVGQGPYQTPKQNAVGQGQYQSPRQNAVGQGQYQTAGLRPVTVPGVDQNGNDVTRTNIPGTRVSGSPTTRQNTNTVANTGRPNQNMQPNNAYPTNQRQQQTWTPTGTGQTSKPANVPYQQGVTNNRMTTNSQPGTLQNNKEHSPNADNSVPETLHEHRVPNPDNYPKSSDYSNSISESNSDSLSVITAEHRKPSPDNYPKSSDFSSHASSSESDYVSSILEPSRGVSYVYPSMHERIANKFMDAAGASVSASEVQVSWNLDDEDADNFDEDDQDYQQWLKEKTKTDSTQFKPTGEATMPGAQQDFEYAVFDAVVKAGTDLKNENQNNLVAAINEDNAKHKQAAKGLVRPTKISSSNASSDSSFFLLYSLPAVIIILVAFVIWRNLKNRGKTIQVLHISDEENANNKVWNPDYSKLIDAKSKEIEPMLEQGERDRDGWD
ncbi:uncharacterized protein [Amphiura filiformis]|uniref:uncharacterized protein n=1 Tax=Amphiura filiformis TaxID=82378 RepID=UPI003B21C800